MATAMMTSLLLGPTERSVGQYLFRGVDQHLSPQGKKHGFVLKSIFQDARKRKKPANIVWLDFKDAFGSVPHPIVLKVLSLTGLQGLTAAIIKDKYMGSTTSIQTGLGRSPQIHCLRGVKQGCPLSYWIT